MAGELVVMSTQEIDRLGVVQQILDGRLSRVKAGELLNLGEAFPFGSCAEPAYGPSAKSTPGGSC